MTHIGYDTVSAAFAVQYANGRQPPVTYRVVLGKVDTAWNPASTKDELYGPATVTYTHHADGGVTAKVGEPPRLSPQPPRSRRSTAPDRRNLGGPRPRNLWI